MGIATLLLAVTIAAQDASLQPGRLVDGVACASDRSQTYALYLPSTFSRDREWPLLLVFDPRGRGAHAASIFQAAAERLGWIIASSNDTRSDGAWEPNRRAVAAMVPDLLARLPVDGRRIHAAGFSGGGGVAWALARDSGQLAGIISVGAPEPGRDGTDPRVAWFGAAGRYDFNYLDARATYERLRGVPRRLAFFDGAHEWFPAAVAAQALEWFDALARGDDAARQDVAPPFSREEARAEQEERQRRGEIGRALTRVYDADPPLAPFLRGALRIPSLQQQSRGQGAGADAARRSLELIFVQTSFYLPRDLAQRGDHARAALALEIAASIHDDRPYVWHELAAAHAMSGSAKAALGALERALATGLTTRAGVADDARFAALRSLPAFAAFLARVPAPR